MPYKYQYQPLSPTPFGSVMLGRDFRGGKYRFGFNTQEKVTELGGGIYTAEFWMYNAQLGRRWNVDPVDKDWESPYLCFNGNPILVSDVDGDDGREAWIILYATQEVAMATATVFPPAAVAVEIFGSAVAVWALIHDAPKPKPIPAKKAIAVTKATQIKGKSSTVNAVKKGPKDLIKEAEEDKEKKLAAEQRVENRKKAAARGNSREGNSNQESPGSHAPSGNGKSKKDRHTRSVGKRNKAAARKNEQK